MSALKVETGMNAKSGANLEPASPALSAGPTTPTGPGGAAAVVTGLAKSFVRRKAQVHAVRDVDLRVERGEYLVILGPSGCGKSTLMRCIAGLEKPTQGRIELSGSMVFDADTGVEVPPERRKLGMVFQDYALWPHMSIEKNVTYPLRMQGVSKKEQADRVAEVLEVLECANLADRLPIELSGGQQQRIALARALVSRPGLLLLDEPLSNLDALLRISLRAELLRLHRAFGFTALHITHDQDEALEMGDRIILMREGRVEQMGPPDEVYQRPVSPYAANFFGVRNNLSCVVKGGRLEFEGAPIEGSEAVSSGWPEGEVVQIFVRSMHTSLRRLTLDSRASGQTLLLRGVLAQVVLGEGGHHRGIVDVQGQQWFVDNMVDAGPGDDVSVEVPVGELLIYRDGKLQP